MKLTIEQVRHVANLARLSLSADEEERFRSQLSAVLDAVETLAQVDTSNVPPTSHVLPAAVHARPDEVGAHLPVEKALENAPQKVGTSFAIPRVIE